MSACDRGQLRLNCKRKRENNASSELNATAIQPDSLVEVNLMQRSACLLPDTFYSVDCVTLARRLLGQVLVRYTDDGRRLSGIVVETECYLGGEDKASHSFGGKRTDRNAAMYMKPATAYVYCIYGIHYCMNVSSQGDGAAVLIRALQPLDGIDSMQKNRNQRLKQKRALALTKLCNGPSKLCQAMDINKVTCNQRDLSECPWLWMERGEQVPSECDIVTSTRIGIESAGEEWAKMPLRFYIKDCKYVSKIDKVKNIQT